MRCVRIAHLDGDLRGGRALYEAERAWLDSLVARLREGFDGLVRTSSSELKELRQAAVFRVDAQRVDDANVMLAVLVGLDDDGTGARSAPSPRSQRAATRGTAAW